MLSTTLFALSGERVLHSSSLATVINNWIVMRHGGTAQSLISIASLSRFRTIKRTTSFVYPAFAAGCFLIAVATAFSQQSDGATLPFSLVSLVLLVGARVTRQASIAIIVGSEVVQTGFGGLHEAASLVTAIRSARGGLSHGEQPKFHNHSWMRNYIALLV